MTAEIATRDGDEIGGRSDRSGVVGDGAIHDGTVHDGTARDGTARDGVMGGAVWRGWPFWLAVAGLAVPFVAVLVVALTSTWYPASDTSLIELRTLDVGTRATPLIGPYSRLGWHHPGPLLFWVLAVPYRLFGSSDRGMLIGAVLVNAAAVAASLRVAYQRAGRTFALVVALFLALLIRGEGAAFLFHTWNPDLPVLPLVFLVLAAWAIVEGDLEWLPVAVLVSCFTWQSHLGYLPVAAWFLGAAVVGLAWALRSGRVDVPGGRRRLVVAGGTVLVGLVCVVPIVADQLFREPGNLGAIVAGFRHPAGAVAGFGTALRIAAMHLGPWGTWISGNEPTEPFIGAVSGASVALLLVPAIAVAAAAALAVRAHAWPALRLLGMLIGAAVVGIVATARTTGDAYPYLFNWFRVIALGLWLAIVWSIVESVRALRIASVAAAPDVPRESVLSSRSSRAGPLGRSGPPAPLIRQLGWPARVASVVPVLLAGLTVAAGVSALSTNLKTELPDIRQSRALEAVVPPMLAVVAGDPQPTFLQMEGSCGREIGDGIGLQLVRAGVDVVVIDAFADGFGARRVGRPTTRTVRVVCGEAARPRIDASPVPVVATYQVLSTAEQAELAALREGFRAEIRAAGKNEYLGVVDSDLLIAIAYKGVAGLDFDADKIGRFGTLTNGQRMSVAVFVQPSA